MQRRTAKIAAGASGMALAAVMTLASSAWLASEEPNFEAPSEDALAALGSVIDQAREVCLDEAQMNDLIADELADAGDAVPYDVRSGGPVAYPLGERDAVKAHIDGGCHIFSGMGYDEVGTRTYYISGPGSMADPTPAPGS
jgi:hypothetical protein